MQQRTADATPQRLVGPQGPILIATDMTEGARTAAQWGHALGMITDTPTVATHVIEPRFGGIFAKRFEPDLTDDRIEGIRGLMDIWYQETTGGEASETEVCGGHAHAALDGLARDRDARMLVMSRTSKGSIQQALIGSRVQQIAQNPPCPLAVVHPQGPPMKRGMHIAVATDFSEASISAIRYAAHLAAKTDSTLSLVHCTFIPASENGSFDDVQEQALGTLTELCTRELEMIRAAVWSDHLGLQIDLHVRTGRAIDILLEFDQEMGVDLMVVGQTGQASTLGALLGSVPRRLLQQTVGHLVIVPRF
ncbi:MAG: universal stress protein [Bradymonadia bacterium]